ncbi:hypothetical protein PTKIN_Ptkin10aG0188600 [Pterospermum kingtungense]
MAVLSKILTNTDVEKRLAIPTKTLPSLPGFNGSHEITIQLMYRKKMWPIVCTIRKKGQYKKPVFSGGWRDFVVRNNIEVGDRLTLFKVHDEAGSFYYKVQVQKLAQPSGDHLSPSSSAEASQGTGTSPTRASNFRNKQDQVLVESDAAPIKQEEAIAEFSDVVVDWPVVAFADPFIPKSRIRIFGANIRDEATNIAHFKAEQESKMKFFGICMGEASIHAYYNEERAIKVLGLAEDSAMPYDTSQAVGDAHHKTRTEGLSLDLNLGQSSTPYAGILTLDLTLAPAIVDGQN